MGQRYVTVRDDGSSIQFYDDAVNPWGTVIPTNAIPLTENEAIRWLTNQGTTRWRNGEIVTVEAPPPPPPEVVSSYQFKAGLLGEDTSMPTLDDVDAWAASIKSNGTAGRLIWMAWETAPTFSRSGQLLKAFAARFNKTDADMDMFLRATVLITA